MPTTIAVLQLKGGAGRSTRSTNIAGREELHALVREGVNL
jgi:MinD-like ATPase involved in chromosome partitioning or flagellar assembly